MSAVDSADVVSNLGLEMTWDLSILRLHAAASAAPSTPRRVRPAKTQGRVC